MTSWHVDGERTYPKGRNPLGNPFYGYRATDLTLPDGRSVNYHGVDVGECVHVVAVEDDGTTYLVEQSRPNARPIGAALVPKTLELPGGFADPDRRMADNAQTEINQEIGRHAKHMRYVGPIWPSPGISNEVDHIYLATDLSAVDPGTPEITEQDLRVVSGPFGELFDSIRSGTQTVSAQTLAAMAMVATLL